MSEKRFIYYMAYGSNLSLERFLCYIKGGTYYLTGRNHKGCFDKTIYFDENKPISHVATGLRLFFGNSASSWNGCAVAFVEEEAKSHTLGRLYKVTEDQFRQIQYHEGSGSSWYGLIIDETTLGYVNEIPIRTFTCMKGCNSPKPTSKKYLDVIKAGLKETGYPQDQINEYLRLVNVC